MDFEIDGFLIVGDDDIPLRITGTYKRGAPAYTPRGEYAPVDPPEPPEFDIQKAQIYDPAHVKLLDFPLSALSEAAYEKLIELCIYKAEDIDAAARIEAEDKQQERDDNSQFGVGA